MVKRLILLCYLMSSFVWAEEYDLTQYYEKIDGHEWLKVPEMGDNAVLIKLNNGETSPKLADEKDGNVFKSNFNYVDEQGNELPSGLYCWKFIEADGKREKQDVSNGCKCQHRPYGKIYEGKGSGDSRVYNDKKGNKWDPKATTVETRSLRNNYFQELHPSAHYNKLLFRPNFFEHVVGLDEETFRLGKSACGKTLSKSEFATIEKDNNNTTSPNGSFTYRNNSLFSKQIQDRNKNSVKLIKLSELKNLQEKYKGGKGSLHLIIDRGHNADINTILAKKEFNDAVFQVASNFDGLEGGMGKQDAFLTNMLAAAVQGEEIAIATSVATIFRKYIDASIHMLSETVKQGTQLSITDKDFDKICIGWHENVKVYYGYSPYKHYNTLVPEDQNQIVHLALNAAINLKGKNVDQDNESALTVLRAMYKGTLLKAIKAKKEKVVLTLLGAGAFRNKLEWVAQAIKECKDLIKNFGLQVYLVFYVPPNREGGALEKEEQLKIKNDNGKNMIDWSASGKQLCHKEPDGQKFLYEMFTLAKEIGDIDPENTQEYSKFLDESGWGLFVNSSKMVNEGFNWQPTPPGQSSFIGRKTKITAGVTVGVAAAAATGAAATLAAKKAFEKVSPDRYEQFKRWIKRKYQDIKNFLLENN